MHLSDLLQGRFDLQVTPSHSSTHQEIAGITHREEELTSDMIFVDFKLKGRPQGHLGPVMRSELDEYDEGLQIVTIDPSSVARHWSLIFHQRTLEDLQLFAVTGTNGKSTVVHMARQLLEFLSPASQPMSLGTLGLEGKDYREETPNTTLLPLDLHPILKRAHQKGSKVIFMEASSHALDEDRLLGLNFSATGWTNLSRDHLDKHHTMENYRSAKAKLFQLSPGPHIVNADEVAFQAWRNRENVQSYSVQHSDANYYYSQIKATPTGFEAQLHENHHCLKVKASFLGLHNLSNSLCAIGLIRCMGFELSALAPALAMLQLPKGRLEEVSTRARGRVFIDYAHTPDALEKTLDHIRPHFPKAKVTVLFGCGGQRDVGKRALMGEVANAKADSIWLSSDNSRHESTLSIIADIQQGIQQSHKIKIEPDRRRAIHKAMADLQENDLLLICGKGHERFQDMGSQQTSLDEFQCCKEF